MLPARQAARQRLRDCTRAEYNSLTHSANLTPFQEKVIALYIIDKLPQSEIAFKLSICESLVRRRLAEVYDKVAKL